MQQHARTYSILTQTLDPLDEVEGQNDFFLNVVMLHIKLEGNGAKSTMQAHILSLHILSTPGVGS